MKILKKILKNISYALTLIYSFDYLLSPINVMVPLNIFFIALVSLLGFPGLFLSVALVLIV